MRFYRRVVLTVSFLLIQSSLASAETAVLKSGREIEIIDGKIPGRVAEELYTEGEGLLKKGRLDLASNNWQWIVDKAKGDIVFRAKAAQEKIRAIEYGSFLVLSGGQILRGKIKVNLRTDLLGLEEKEEIGLWQIKEIAAEYHPGYSQVSKTFYPLTLLEIRFRNGQMKSSRTSNEIEFSVEGNDGSITKAIVGKEYEILRPANIAEQIEALTRDRTIKVVVYPDLKKYQ